MQQPLTPPIEVISAIEALIADPIPTNGENSDELAAALATAGLIDKVNLDHLELFSGRDPEAYVVTLATMPKTYQILFPRSLACGLGRPSISIPVSSILRWFAVRQDHDRAPYFLQMAEKVEELGSVAAPLQPQWQQHAARVHSLAEIASWIADGDVKLSQHGRSHVGGMIVEATRHVLTDDYSRNVEIMMPSDHLPDWIEPGSKHYGIGLPVGLALTYLADEAEHSDPALARKLGSIVSEYYPDDVIEVEILRPDEQFFLVDLATLRSRPVSWDAVRRIRPLPGSVSLRHYADGSVYSTDDTKHPYRLVRCWIGDDEDDEESWEERCLLFSDEAIVHAYVARDIEN